MRTGTRGRSEGEKSGAPELVVAQSGMMRSMLTRIWKGRTGEKQFCGEVELQGNSQ